MATHLSKIYNDFIIRSADSKLITKEKDETDEDRIERIEDILGVYLRSAINSFNVRRPKQIKMNFETGMFDEDIDDIVIEILIVKMLESFAEKKLNYLNSLAQSVRTKDFEVHSKANELKAVIEIVEMYRKKLRRLEASYDWKDVDANDLSG